MVYRSTPFVIVKGNMFFFSLTPECFSNRAQIAVVIYALICFYVAVTHTREKIPAAAAVAETEVPDAVRKHSHATASDRLTILGHCPQYACYSRRNYKQHITRRLTSELIHYETALPYAAYQTQSPAVLQWHGVICKSLEWPATCLQCVRRYFGKVCARFLIVSEWIQCAAKICR